MAQQKQVQFQRYSNQLASILENIEPGLEFHRRLQKLQGDIERKWPMLNALPQNVAAVPLELLQIYAYHITSMMYDKNCGNDITELDVTKMRAIKAALEQVFGFNPQSPNLPACQLRELRTYGHLVIILSDFDLDDEIISHKNCILQFKYILNLFHHYNPEIANCTAARLSEILDDDAILLYVLASLFYANSLLKLTEAQRNKMGEMATLFEIRKIYQQGLLQRFNNTPHLNPNQIAMIKENLNTLESLVFSGRLLLKISATFDCYDLRLAVNNARNLILLYKSQLGEAPVLDEMHSQFTSVYWQAHKVIFKQATRSGNSFEMMRLKTEIEQRFANHPVLDRNWLAIANRAITLVWENELDEETELFQSMINNLNKRERAEKSVENSSARVRMNFTVNLHLHFTEQADGGAQKKSKGLVK